jgi:hypothetical protein
MAHVRKATCGECGGDEINVNDQGVLVRHRQQLMTAAGIRPGVQMCAGGGQAPEVDGADLSAERFPAFSELDRERWAA